MKHLKIICLIQVVSGRCLAYAFWISPAYQRAFGIFRVTEQFFVPLIILTFCYGRIIFVLSKRASSNHDRKESKNDQFELAKRNTINTFLIISVCFVICWTNSRVFYLMFNLGYGFDWESTYSTFATLMAFGNCTINPFIYLIKYRDYQTALKSCLFCKQRGRGGNKEHQQDTIGTSLSTGTSRIAV